MKKVELLAPAAGWPALRAAVESGADAVYFGVGSLNMRANAKNFSLQELKKVVDYCHENRVKAYLAVNTIVYEDELGKAGQILKKAKQAGIDAVILWDMSVLEEARKLKLNIHLSTQASVSNSKSANFYKKLGVSRIILARECSLKQIKEISRNSKVEIETFVHGAMCVSISGRCFLSQEIFGRSANRGECLQPCRREYIIQDAEENHTLKLGKDYVMSPKDLCALPFIDRLVKSGITAFKIEGRNRSPEYVKVVTSAYRSAIDDYYNKKLTKEKIKSYIEKLKKVYNRGFSSGFYLGLPAAKDFTHSYGSRATTRKKYIGFVKNYYKQVNVAEVKLEAGDLKLGDSILIIGNKTGVKEEKVASIQISKKPVKKAKKGMKVGIKTRNLLRLNDKVYLIKSAN
ncbi:U32 family peptidase [Candidatus Woesearchaeota archaeon]|nr:U32 family peptidase [Candidatus Woesearchaeota archaeon]